MTLRSSEIRDSRATEATPHLLGRPLLFEITELERPTSGIALRWLVNFCNGALPRLVFDLVENLGALSGQFVAGGRCYELLENGQPCQAGCWHFGPESARNAVIAAVEYRLKGQDCGDRISEEFRSGTIPNIASTASFPTAFLRSLSSPGVEILTLFRIEADGL
jgi:hypothetical protein